MPTILLTLLQTAGVAFMSKLLGAAVTERMFADLFFKLAEWFVLRSSNGIDDDVVKNLKAAYYGKEV